MKNQNNQINEIILTQAEIADSLMFADLVAIQNGNDKTVHAVIELDKAIDDMQFINFLTDLVA